MSSLSRELVFLILQFLEEEKFKESVHKYGLFFLFFFVFISLSHTYLCVDFFFFLFLDFIVMLFVSGLLFLLGC